MHVIGCVHICVCIYVHVRVHMYVIGCVHNCICVYVYMYMYNHYNVHASMLCMYVIGCMHTCMCVCIYVHVQYMHVRIIIYY